ncbi:ABC transporter ATP-binding protein [Actinomyces sp. 2119]|uniref:ABC transporter ATP-binding protein n=1 Tax=Actinomyces sp. 2119 TaxID=2321393 RepID=UPI000E6BD8D2|nr:ABC transporter ATP-binding protein [Actinomyces sp. 2119]RJF41986.1 ABC transporter ATP-binding protein [Actinomyces sp. 2119]
MSVATGFQAGSYGGVGPQPQAPAVPGHAGRRGETVVEARGLTRVYGSGEAQVIALDEVSLAVQRGQFVAIMGASGSGKSTLLHCLAGLDAPTQGQVLIAGRDITAMRDQELTTLRRDQLGFVFQSFNLLPTLSAEENILLPLRLAHRKPDTDWYNAVVTVLGIENRLEHRPSELSGGQQQRVAVARALIGRPAVVFADEPTGALDTASSAALLDVLAQTCQTLGQTVVMVTHDPEAAATTSRIIRLADGRITQDQAVERRSGAHAASAPAPGTNAPAAPGTQAQAAQAPGHQVRAAASPGGASWRPRHAAGSL